MRPCLFCLLAVLGAAPLWADELPMPRRLPPGDWPKGGKPGMVTLEEDDDDAAPASAAELRTQILKLKGEREALNQDRAKAGQAIQDPLGLGLESQETAKLRLRLGGLLAKLGAHKAQSGAPAKPSLPDGPKLILPSPPPKDTEPDPKVAPPTKEPAAADLSKALDPLALAQALFQAGNYPGALQTYRMLSLEGLRAEEWAPIQYMIAACLRKVGKADEAASLFREIANSRGDETLATCAQWQIHNLRWERELAVQLKEIRDRRQALESGP